MLRKEFTELRAVSGDQLMYVKEDLIIPHHYTFYDFIVTKVGCSSDDGGTEWRPQHLPQ